MVVWEGSGRKLGFKNVEDKDGKWSMTLPQVITSTVTRRTIKKTWRERTVSGQS